MTEENTTGAGKNTTFGMHANSEESMNKGYIASAKNMEKKKTTPEEYFRWSVFGITMLLLFIATIQFYFSMEDVISTWFEHQYAPLFRSIYNLVIIVLCVYIIKLFVFRNRA